MNSPSLKRQLFAEFLGTAALLCAVIGSGIMAEHLSAGNNGVALLANTLATVFALYVLIEVLGPVSGAHFKPLATLVVFLGHFLFSKSPVDQSIRARTAILYIAAQLLGAIAGAWLANAMFELPVLQLSSKVRANWGQYLAEAVATTGLILVVLRAPGSKAAGLVACWGS
jgi:glycerol uptake facilitator-like aquaporin